MARILIAEDDPGIALGLRDDLTLEGYDVDVVGDGEAAAARALGESWDLLLLDLMLPRKDGFEVCRELRRRGVDTPIVILTARDQNADKVLGLELGADDYVVKPFSPLELCARLKAVLRRTRAAAHELIRFGDLEVDLGRCQLRRGGREIPVTPLEFKVLAALIRARGRLLTRSQLIEQAWGHGVAITDRVVDNHVLNLRRKLEDDGSAPRLLLSVRGLGYRFDPGGHA